jgi:hypothetical protein
MEIYEKYMNIPTLNNSWKKHINIWDSIKSMGDSP